ncbi:MAG: hypothetical protein ACK5NE_08545 [Brachymonas sp.]
MTTKDEALERAIDALTQMIACHDEPACPAIDCSREAIAACREALTQKDEQEPLPIPRTPEDISTFLMANYSAATFAKSPDDPDYDDVYELSVSDLLEAFDNWEAFDCFPPKRKPLTDGEIDAIAESMPDGLKGFCVGCGWRQFSRAIEAHHGIGGEA